MRQEQHRFQMQLEEQRQEDQRRIEQEKLNRERIMAEAQASKAKVQQEAMEAEKRRRMAILAEQKRQLVADDWNDGQNSSVEKNSSNSADSEYLRQLDEEREQYIKNMNKKFGKTLN
jgi:hypothetical protein